MRCFSPPPKVNGEFSEHRAALFPSLGLRRSRMRAVSLLLVASSAAALVLPPTGKAQATRRESLGRALALVPLVALPARGSAANKVGYINDSLEESAARQMADSAGVRGATVNLTGRYTDPLHPGCARKVSKSCRL